MRWLLRSLLAMGALCALVLVFVTALLWVLGSEQGAAWIVGRLTQRTNGAINVGRVEGTLLGGIRLTNVAIRLARDEVDIPTLTFSWAVAASLSGDLVLDDVRAGAVQYRRLPPRGPARPPGSYRLDLPLAIAVRRATLASLTLNAANESLVFGETRAAAARFADSRLTLQDLVTESSGVQLTGDGEVRLGEAIYLGADIEWLQPALEQPLGGRLTLEGDLPVLRVHHEFAPPLAIVADGVLTTTSPPRVDLTIEWRDFAVPGVSDVRSDSGRLVLSGTVDGYTFDSAGEVMALGNAGTFAINGSGQAGVLMVDTVTLDSARGRVTANGEVAFDVLELDLAVGIENLDPSWLVQDWPGRLTGTGRVTAALTPLTWSVDALDVSGELRGLPLAATGAVDFAADELYRLSSVELTSGASRVTLDGAFGAAGEQPLELSVGADIAALQVLWPRSKDRSSRTSSFRAPGRRLEPAVEPRRETSCSASTRPSASASQAALGSMRRRRSTSQSKPTRSRAGRCRRADCARRSKAARERIESPSRGTASAGIRASPVPAVSPPSAVGAARSRRSRSTRKRSAHGA